MGSKSRTWFWYGKLRLFGVSRTLTASSLNDSFTTQLSKSLLRHPTTILKGLNHSAHGCRVCEATMGNAHQKTFPTLKEISAKVGAPVSDPARTINFSGKTFDHPVPILKGLNHSAQRCEERATLGVRPINSPTLKGLNHGEFNPTNTAHQIRLHNASTMS